MTERLDVERMNYLMTAASQGVAIDVCCKTDLEREFYRELQAATDRLKKEMSGRLPVAEWP